MIQHTPFSNKQTAATWTFLKYKEYLVYDFVGIIGAIGGTLGLFSQEQLYCRLIMIYR